MGGPDGNMFGSRSWRTGANFNPVKYDRFDHEQNRDTFRLEKYGMQMVLLTKTSYSVRGSPNLSFWEEKYFTNHIHFNSSCSDTKVTM